MDTVQEVRINGIRYVAEEGDNEEERERLARLIAEFTVEGDAFWAKLFKEQDTGSDGQPMGMYAEGDEKAPFFTEAFLYNLLGKDEARTVLGIMRRLTKLAGVEVSV